MKGRPLWFECVLAVTLFALPGAAGLDPEKELLPENPLEGREIFVQKGCVVCHSVYGSGGTLGPDLAVAAGGKHFLQLAGLLWNHTPRMMEVLQKKGKEWPELKPDEMTHIFAYLYSLNYFEPAGDFSTGREIFYEKKCVFCHTVGNEGGAVGPRLDGYAREASAIALASALWNHGPKMRMKLPEDGVPMPVFRGSEVADILAYIRGASLEPWRPRRYLPLGSPVRGHSLFHSKGCIHCHSIRGQGGKVGPDLATVAFPANAASVAGILWNHSALMERKMQELKISWISMTPEEMADIISFLYYLEYTETRGDAARGAKLFQQERGCGLCHTGNKKGGPGSPPDLRRSEVIRSPGALAAAMWNHAATMLPRMKERKVPWPLFERNDLADILAYLQQASPPVPASSRDTNPVKGASGPARSGRKP